MKAVALSFLALVVFTASGIVILDRVFPAAGGRVVPATASEPAATDPAVLKKLAAIEARLKAMSDGLRTGPASTDSRATEWAPPITVAQRLESIEESLFDFERNSRREIRLLYEKTRRRFDEIDATLAGVTSRPATPEQRLALTEELKKKGVTYSPEAKRFEVEGMFGQPTRELEFLGVGDGGAVHEALLLINAVPSAMKRATLDMGIKPGKAANFAANQPPTGDGLHVYVEWKGRPTPVRIEKLIRNQATGSTLVEGPLVFVGSRDIINEQSWDAHFAADVYQNILGVAWKFSGDTVFAAADPSGADEHGWGPNLDLVPPPETPVKLIFSKDRVPEWDG